MLYPDFFEASIASWQFTPTLNGFFKFFNSTIFQFTVPGFILAIVWQLMRAHTLKVIGERSEEELIAWANEKVSQDRRIKNLKEKKLNDGLFWIELLAAIEPRSIRWDFVVKDNPSDKDKEMNAKYALSVARGLGALIFVVWEDITEVKSKLLLTFLASIYDVTQTRAKKED